jgi:hypothetical protein
LPGPGLQYFYASCIAGMTGVPQCLLNWLR